MRDNTIIASQKRRRQLCFTKEFFCLSRYLSRRYWRIPPLTGRFAKRP
nr:MAG TPA: hypothetical protein [Caudoviricetes sp.]